MGQTPRIEHLREMDFPHMGQSSESSESKRDNIWSKR